MQLAIAPTLPQCNLIHLGGELTGAARSETGLRGLADQCEHALTERPEVRTRKALTAHDVRDRNIGNT